MARFGYRNRAGSTYFTFGGFSLITPNAVAEFDEFVEEIKTFSNHIRLSQ